MPCACLGDKWGGGGERGGGTGGEGETLLRLPEVPGGRRAKTASEATMMD